MDDYTTIRYYLSFFMAIPATRWGRELRDDDGRMNALGLLGETPEAVPPTVTRLKIALLNLGYSIEGLVQANNRGPNHKEQVVAFLQQVRHRAANDRSASVLRRYVYAKQSERAALAFRTEKAS